MVREFQPYHTFILFFAEKQESQNSLDSNKNRKVIMFYYCRIKQLLSK